MKSPKIIAMKYLSLTILGLFCTMLSAQVIDIETFATGLNNPIGIKHAGDTRLFIVEQAGLIQIVNSDGSKNATPFLDINSIVINGGGERGLLGLAFHPDYASNGYFYVNYNDNSGNTVVSRFSRDATDPDLADAGSELQLLTFSQPYTNHNGGDMAFGADGYLYIASGDGGSGGDPGDRAQSLSTLLGKLLRIDVDNTSNGNNYAIPADNPFFGSATERQEIWAYGLRNTWRFSFDRTTNDLWIADVGQGSIEEINMVASTASGVNYGWRCYEGNTAYNLSGNCPAMGTLTFPVSQYLHSGDGLNKCSIIGGYRYRGTAQPTLAGFYFFADYCSNEIGYLQFNGSSWTRTFTGPFTGNGWTTFGEDVNGELFIAGNTSDTVYRIVDATLGINDADAFAVTMFPNPAKHHFTIENLNPSVAIDTIKIYDIQGGMITSLNDLTDNQIEISATAFYSGMYFVEISNTNGGRTIKKLIKN